MTDTAAADRLDAIAARIEELYRPGADLAELRRIAEASFDRGDA